MGSHSGTGKQVQRSVYGKTQQEVRKKLQQITHEIDRGVFVEPSRLKLGRWLDAWQEDYLINVKSSTKITYIQHIENHIKPALGNVQMLKLSGAQIQKLYNTMQRDKGLSPKMVRLTHGVLHKALDQAVRLGFIRINPAKACTLPRMTQKEIQPLDDPELVAFLAAAEGFSHEYLFKTAVFTGMRQGELLGLTWDCVDFSALKIRVEKQLLRPRRKGDSYVFGSLKNDKVRIIQPAKTVFTILKKQRLWQSQCKLKAGEIWHSGSFEGLVFTNEIGSHLSYQIVYRAFKSLIERAGIEHNRRFHDLRHTYAVNSLRALDDVKTVQENLGHATAAFTLDKYAHVTDTMRRDSANRMEAFIEKLNVENL